MTRVTNHLSERNYTTGRIFPTKEVMYGHKDGLLCLRCGIYCKGLLCDVCKELTSCKMCGIVCRPSETYDIFTYQQKKGDRVNSVELYQSVRPFCQILENGFCEDCKDWEKMIKDKCFLCNADFDNSYQYYKERGNCCSGCLSQINFNNKVFDKNGLLKNKNMVRRKMHFVTDDYDYVE